MVKSTHSRMRKALVTAVWKTFRHVLTTQITNNPNSRCLKFRIILNLRANKMNRNKGRLCVTVIIRVRTRVTIRARGNVRGLGLGFGLSFP